MGNVAFDADLAANMLGDLVGTPTLYAGDVELGKSAGGHAVMIVAENRTATQAEAASAWLGSTESLGRGCPPEHSTRAVVDFRGDRVERVLGERGQVGVLVQVLAQQPIGVLVGALSASCRRTYPRCIRTSTKVPR